MFSAIKLKLYAAGAFVLAILAYYIKSLRRENKELKHKEKIHERLDKTRDAQESGIKENTREMNENTKVENEKINSNSNVDLNSL